MKGGSCGPGDGSGGCNREPGPVRSARAGVRGPGALWAACRVVGPRAVAGRRVPGTVPTSKSRRGRSRRGRRRVAVPPDGPRGGRFWGTRPAVGAARRGSCARRLARSWHRTADAVDGRCVTVRVAFLFLPAFLRTQLRRRKGYSSVCDRPTTLSLARATSSPRRADREGSDSSEDSSSEGGM